MNTVETGRESFFTRDRTFYRQLFSIFIMVALQNLVAYSVNMIDNLMLGSYAQTSLSGAATVNQIFFLVQQVSITICDAHIILASQYFGQGRLSPVRRITGLALKLGLGCGLFFSAVCALFPAQVLGFFTRDGAIVAQGMAYMRILLFSFPLFILTSVLMAALRCVGTVRISFYISVVSLIVNTAINYTLIFGHFGFPEMGIRGAAIGTLTARILEFAIVLFYVYGRDKKLALFSEPFLSGGRELAGDFFGVAVPVMIMGLIWAVSVPLQTAILGHLLSRYSLTPAALRYADQILLVLCFVMVGMSYQMPVCNGILRGSGDTTFTMWLNIISIWAIVMPLSLLAAFVWCLPVPLVVLAIQSDQIFKGLPVLLRLRSGRWIRYLTRE